MITSVYLPYSQTHFPEVWKETLRHGKKVWGGGKIGLNILCVVGIETRMAAPSTPYKLQKHVGMTITTTMTYSRRAMGYLWDRRTELDPQQVAILESLYNNRKKGSLECSFTSKYKHSVSKAGKLGYGRLFGSKGSLEKLERECRGTLCKDHYYDIDVVNAHPVMLLQFAKRNYNKDLVELQNYIDNRDALLKEICENRDDAKKAVIAVMYNGKPSFMSGFLMKLYNEIHTFAKFLFNQAEFADLKEAVKNEDNIYGSFLSYVLQTIECDVMLVMKQSLEKLGWAVDVLAYDGVMVRKTESTKLDEHLRLVEADIKERTGFELKLLVKPFDSFELPPLRDEIVDGVLRDDYMQMKAEFEMNHFYFAPTNTYGMLYDGQIKFLDLAHATEMFQTKWRFVTGSKFNDYVEFFKLWRCDPTRRTINKIDYQESNDAETFVLPLDFEYKKADEEHNQEALDLFLEIINLNTNKVAVLFDWVIKFYAHMLQKPFELPTVGLVKSGIKGCGKDTVDDFLIQYVLGDKYGVSYQNNVLFFDKHDCNRMNRFFCKLEEADRKLCMNNSSYLKSLITNSKSMFNPKGKDSFSLPNYMRYVFTTNKANPMEMNDGERRFVILPCSAEKKHDFNYWVRVRKVLFSKSGGATVAKYLMSVDLSAFNIHEQPENAYQKEVVESEKSSEERFIEYWDGEKAAAPELYKLYRQYCSDNDLPYVNSSAVLGRLLLKFVRDNVLVAKRGAGNINYYTKP